MAARPDFVPDDGGGYVRKGLWLPLPAFEFGAGALSILGSRMYSLQGYAKMALQEGLPRLVAAVVLGARLGVAAAGDVRRRHDRLRRRSARVEGVRRRRHRAHRTVRRPGACCSSTRASGVLDATPTCDAYASHNTPAMSPAPSGCTAASNGTWDDLNANFTFPKPGRNPAPEVVRRLQAPAVGAVHGRPARDRPAGTSHDDASGAADRSSTQQTYSLSGGFDF
jgi:hypothetical protein